MNSPAAIANPAESVANCTAAPALLPSASNRSAPDYIIKPFDPRELLARVRSVLRRVATPSPPVTLGREVRIGRCMINLDSRKLFALDGDPVPDRHGVRPPRVFCEYPNRVLSRDRLLDLAHGKEIETFDRSIDTRIARLRQKIEANPEHPAAIRTVRGAGYMFVPGNVADS